MASVTLWGDTYSNVTSVALPKTGGGLATFTEGGGGGASNLVMGTFTTGSTRAGTGSTTISYSGSGYPIALMVYVDGGAYNNSTGGNTTWYNSLQRYAIGAFYMTKSQIPSSAMSLEKYSPLQES